MSVKNAVLGTWTGIATTPWVPPYQVTFTFDNYTHYSARSLQGTQPALYYGIDDNSLAKLYEIQTLLANGDAIGTIDIVFSTSQLPGQATRDLLEGVHLSVDGTRLQFYYLHVLSDGVYGPMQYDLQRSTP
jgi:hypothetical protein